MAHTRGDVVRTLGLGAALAVLTALACLVLAAQREARTLSLVDLAQTQTVLMSCAAPDAPSSEPLWCADPSSPSCSPAAPDAPRLALADSPDLSVHDLALPDPLRAYSLSTWPEPHPARRRVRVDGARLERPPRG